MTVIEVKVPDIGDFADVPIIELLVKPGDEVSPEDPLVTLESDKATMDVPAPFAGVVKELKVKVGDKVAEGAVLLTLDATDSPEVTTPTESGTAAPAAAPGAAPATAPAGSPAAAPAAEPAAAPAAAPAAPPAAASDTHVVVIGSGPGGYTAAFRAADLGMKSHAHRTLRDPGRRLPQRRLHPVQGAAARGPRDRRDRGDG